MKVYEALDSIYPLVVQVPSKPIARDPAERGGRSAGTKIFSSDSSVSWEHCRIYTSHMAVDWFTLGVVRRQLLKLKQPKMPELLRERQTNHGSATYLGKTLHIFVPH